jgi:chromosome segregation ATPase
LSDKQTIIFALESENDFLKREMSRRTPLNKQFTEENSTTSILCELKSLQEKSSELEKDLKAKQTEIQNLTNQNLYLKEQHNTLQMELKNAKHSLLSLKRSQYLISQSKSEENLKLESEKTENLLKKLQSLKKTNDENQKIIENLIKTEESSKKELISMNSNFAKMREEESILIDRCKSLEKDLSSQKEITFSYRKKYEELSVEVTHLSERIIYKDEAIKRDAERIKQLKEVELEFSSLKRNFQELENLNKQLINKNEMIVENMIREREKWLAKEAAYFNTIDNLQGNFEKANILKHFYRSNSLTKIPKKTSDDSLSLSMEEELTVT